METNRRGIEEAALADFTSAAWIYSHSWSKHPQLCCRILWHVGLGRAWPSLLLPCKTASALPTRKLRSKVCKRLTQAQACTIRLTIFSRIRAAELRAESHLQCQEGASVHAAGLCDVGIGEKYLYFGGREVRANMGAAAWVGSGARRAPGFSTPRGGAAGGNSSLAEPSADRCGAVLGAPELIQLWSHSSPAALTKIHPLN